MGRKMKIVLLTSGRYPAANTAVRAFLGNTLLQKYGIEIVGIVSTEIWTLNQRGWRTLRNFVKQSGLPFALRSIATTVWQNCMIRFAKYCVPDRNRKFFEIEELAHQYKIPFLCARNINSKTVYRFIKKKEPDCLVSCLLLQIVKKPLLNLPPQGAINFHPALLQEHRGTFTSFWALLQNRSYSGATVHYMTERPDDGQVILQRRFFIKPSDTIHCVNQKSAQLGGNLLVKALVKIKKKSFQPRWVEQLGQLLTFPNRREAGAFHQQGKGHMRWRDYWRV